MNYFPDLRRYKRIALSVPLEIRRVSECGRLCRNRLVSYTDDLSAGGVMCEVERSIPIDTVVRVKLVIKSQSEPFEITGEIAWIEQVNGNGTYRVGIEFMKIDKEKRNFIVQYIYTNGNGH